MDAIEKLYGGRPVSEYGRWWTNCDRCGASITIRAVESPTLPDSNEWEDGLMPCPVCGGPNGGWNADPR